MKHSFDCFCIKCQQEDVPQRPLKLVIAAVVAVLALALAFAQHAQASPRTPPDTEQTKCFTGLGDKRFGDKVTVGNGVELCAGTYDAKKTLACFTRAFTHEDDGGLGLPLGLAVKLCRSI